MLQLTYAPDGTTSWTSGLLLCNTTRSITELNVEFNHQRVIAISQLAASLGGGAAFALQQPALFTTTGALRIVLQGVTTNVTLYMLNAGVQGIRNKFEDLGIAPAFDYTFNGGLITTTSPF